MRITKKEINGIKYQAYNDSNVEWVVSCDNHSLMRFDKRKFTMKEAIEFYRRIFNEE